MFEIQQNKPAWRALKKLIYAIETGKITLVADPDVFDPARHIYGLRAIAGLMAVLLCQALGRDVPLVTIKF